MTAAISFWVRSSGPRTGTSSKPVHVSSRSRRAATAAMSLVATVGADRSGTMGPYRTPCWVIEVSCQSTLSMKDGMVRARYGTPVAAIRSSIASVAVTCPARPATGVPRPSAEMPTTRGTAASASSTGRVKPE